MKVAPGTAVPVPEYPDDDGSADPRLRAAMQTGEPHRQVLAALVGARLLVPVVAVLDVADDSASRQRLRRGREADVLLHETRRPGADPRPHRTVESGGEKDSHMASVELTSADGRRALLAFTGVDALAAWRPDARPVPARADRVAASALQDGVDAVLLDVAGPVPYELPRPDLVGLAAGDPYGPAHTDPTVVSAIAAAVRGGLGPGTEFRVGPGVQGADAQVLLPTADGAERVAEALATDPTLARHCPAGIALTIRDR